MERQPPPPQPCVARMRALVGHLAAGKAPAQALAASAASPALAPRPLAARSDATRWNGWGFRDTRMFVNADGVIEVSGDRYPDIFPAAVPGAPHKRLLPQLLPWAERTIGLSPARRSPAAVLAAEELHVLHESPYARADDGALDEFLALAAERGLRASRELEERVRHGHGQTCEDVFRLRHKREIDRVPDAVVWPASHADVEALVKLAVERSDRICLFPFGGGTNVTNALDCNPTERRAIVSVDMGKMTRILRVDKENLLVTVEAGATGLDLHDRLALMGLTLGHEPDSWEFSTLGGWVSTRASGMKKNRYGNIEDLVVNIKAVTAQGTLCRAADAPRVSMGPDVQEMLLGSEGTLGIVTEVTMRVSYVPHCQVYDSFIFPDFASGLAMLHEATRSNCMPASLRLMDNTQFQLGQVLKPSTTTAPSTSVIDYAKKAYVTKIRGFQVDSMCAATVVMEGTREEVAAQQATLQSIAKRHGGLPGGSENGKRGYYLTYLIAYLRDFALDYYFLSESFESSVPWSNARALCRDVKRAINGVAAEHGVIAPPLVACRISQVYATGVCVYVYYGVNYFGVRDPLALFRATEQAAVDAMVGNGAALSHHHGVGKHRREWLARAVSPPAVAALRGVKRALDPRNVFATANLLEGGL